MPDCVENVPTSDICRIVMSYINRDGATHVDVDKTGDDEWKICSTSE